MKYTPFKYIGAGLTALCVSITAVKATPLPDQISVIVPFAPGGAVDVLTRLLTRQLATETGTNFIVENKPGAGGAIAAAQVARAKPDGRTILMGTTNTHGINTHLNPQLKYDPIKDFTPIADVAENIVILAANANFPAQNLTETIELLRKEPGKYSFGSPGIGSVHQMAMEQFKDKLALDVVHVAYKGAGPAMADTAAGNVQLVMAGIAPAMPFLQDKRIKILGIANPKSDMFSGVKEVANIQYFSDIQPETAAQSWIALFAPAGTDTSIVNQLHGAVQKILTSDSFKKELIPMGMVPNISSRDEFSTKVQENMAFWKKTIQQPATTNQ